MSKALEKIISFIGVTIVVTTGIFNYDTNPKVSFGIWTYIICISIITKE